MDEWKYPAMPFQLPELRPTTTMPIEFERISPVLIQMGTLYLEQLEK